MSDVAGTGRSSRAAPIRIRLDPTRCGGHGICALISGERIGLDAWGFAVVDPTLIEETTLRRRARRAVAACPRGALSMAVMSEPARSPAAPHERGLWWLLVPATAAIAGLTALASVTWTSGRGAAVPASAQVGTGVPLPTRPAVASPPAPPAEAVPSTGTGSSSDRATASPAIPNRSSTGPTGGEAGSSAGTVVAPEYPVLDQGARQPSGAAPETGGTDSGDGGGSGTAGSDSGAPDGSGPDGSGSSAATSTSSGTSPSGGDSPTSTTSTTTGTQAPGGTTGDR